MQTQLQVEDTVKGVSSAVSDFFRNTFSGTSSVADISSVFLCTSSATRCTCTIHYGMKLSACVISDFALACSLLRTTGATSPRNSKEQQGTSASPRNSRTSMNNRNSGISVNQHRAQLAAQDDAQGTPMPAALPAPGSVPMRETRTGRKASIVPLAPVFNSDQYPALTSGSLHLASSAAHQTARRASCQPARRASCQTARRTSCQTARRASCQTTMRLQQQGEKLRAQEGSCESAQFPTLVNERFPQRSVNHQPSDRLAVNMPIADPAGTVSISVEEREPVIHI